MKMVIKAARLGSAVQELTLDEGATIGDVVREMGGADNCEVRRNNEPVESQTPLQQGDIVTIVPAIKGGI